jgi:hypothetical protein
MGSTTVVQAGDLNGRAVIVGFMDFGLSIKLVSVCLSVSEEFGQCYAVV